MMNNPSTPNLMLLIIWIAFHLGTLSPCQAKSDNLRDLGSENQIVYIDIDKLPTKITHEHKPVFDLYDAKRAPGSFYKEWHWGADKCWAGSVLREGVVAYCLPYAKLGQHISVPYYHQTDTFVSIGPCIGLYVWYERKMNRFYLWSVCWNFTNVLGPFVGNPNIVLKQSIKPRKPERQFPGVSLSAISQRWLYEDERQARMPRDEHYDCVHGHLSGRAIEQEKLNTFITRFRLVNNSKTDLFYLANNSRNDPIGYTLVKFQRTDLDRAQSRYYAYEQWANINWRPLPHGSSVDFEVVERSSRARELFYAVILNNEPTLWDEIELLGKYMSMFRTFKNELGLQPWSH